jgi:preprotein translocase subunit YajC
MVMTIFLADAQEVAQPMDQGFTQTMVMVAVALIFFYFILWRPEQKRRKKQEEQRSGIKKGDRITTVGGVIGTVTKINADTVVLKMLDGARIEFVKASIADVQSASEEEAKKAEQDN